MFWNGGAAIEGQSWSAGLLVFRRKAAAAGSGAGHIRTSFDLDQSAPR
jgi:hypothetical protein